jgi:hypothetical protein
VVGDGLEMGGGGLDHMHGGVTFTGDRLGRPDLGRTLARFGPCGPDLGTWCHGCHTPSALGAMAGCTATLVTGVLVVAYSVEVLYLLVIVR